ncbi:uncharacterized protein LOC143099227 [Alosa pseudoharengus]|uniref:uncharacterized protein LOC143099227 n=1 Tax=Alosa pseudoharengus TaxID=34774 RepID=UPI003F8AB312
MIILLLKMNLPVVHIGRTNAHSQIYCTVNSVWCAVSGERKGNSAEVKGFTRGGIVILCKFNDRDEHKDRYFCKGNATTCPYHRLNPDTDRRVTLLPSVLWNDLSVVITNLTLDDAGIYHCAEDGKLLTAVHLGIEEDDCCGQTIRITEGEGGKAIIQCKYPVEFADNIKHICAHKTCMEINLSESKPNISKKVSLSDNKSENIFTVTIHNLERKDAGIYWCAVRPGKIHATLLGRVELQVLEKAPVEDGKRPLQNTRTPVFLVLIVALVIAVALFLCYKRRQRGKQDRSNRVIYPKTVNLDPDGIYEEIEDIGPPPLTSRCNYTKVDNAGDPTYYTIQSPPNFPDDTGPHLLSKTSHTQITTVYATVELPTIPGNVPTYSNIQSPIHTSADTHLSTGTDEIDSTVSTVYTTAQCPNNPSGIPTPCTDNPDPTNPANQEPKYTNEDTVCKTPHSPTHSSDDPDYSLVCSLTSTQVNTVYVNTKHFMNNDGTMCAEKVPSKPIDLELTAQVEPSYPGISAVCIPSGTTHTDLHTTQLPSYKNDDDPVYPNFQVPINPDNELTHAPEPMTSADSTPKIHPIHVPTNPSPDHIDPTFQGSSN